MNALRDVLENLPRAARRLMRVQKISGVAFDFSVPLHLAATRDHLATVRADWVLPRVERPPDKGGGSAASAFGSLRDAGGRWWRFRAP